LKVTVNHSSLIILLDTGCSTCILPHEYANGLNILTNTVRLTAANGTNITTLGQVQTTLQLQSQQFMVNFQVSEEVDEVILGLSFISLNDVVWSFKTNAISLNGIWHKLRCMPNRSTCRRIVVRDTVAIPPRSQVIIQTIAPLRSWTPSTDACLLETSEPTGGLFVARLVYPSTTAHGAVTVCNIRDSELHLEKGTVLGTTNPVTLMTDTTKPPINTVHENIAPDRLPLVKQIIDDILTSLPPAMTHAQRQHAYM